jgi:ribulose-phosphate 3-epimerase
MNTPIIAASILSADFGNLAKETQAVIDAGADYIHFDVMDFHFVPNLSFGPFICKTLRQHNIKAPIDAHLMVTNPQVYVEPFAKAGADLLTFHTEVVDNPLALVKKIQQCGMNAGVALNPETPVNILKNSKLLKSLKLVLVMTVHPGFSGQSFIEGSLEKIQAVRKMLNESGSKAYLAVDGGIKLSNIKKIAQAGADFIVLGSGIFGTKDYTQTISALKQKIKKN